MRRVWCRPILGLGLGLILGGCGFQSGAASGGPRDGGPDGAIDGAIDGPGSGAPTDCFQHWRDGSVSVSASPVREIMELSSAGSDRNPWVSDDGLRIYFSRELGGPATSDIYLASRRSTADPFGEPAPVASLNSTEREGRVSLTPDELTLVLSTNRTGHLDIHMNTRGSDAPFGAPDPTFMANVNSVGTLRADPFLTADRLRLYLAADSPLSGKLQLLVAARASSGADFAVPVLVPGIDDSGMNQSDPTLSRDELVLVYSAFPVVAGDADLWFATRPTATAAFGAPARLPTVNTAADEFDPALSADGCDLYFASTRNGGKFHIFHAQVTR
jgi:hypothetical protein